MVKALLTAAYRELGAFLEPIRAMATISSIAPISES
jgi:hypothetical protein